MSKKDKRKARANKKMRKLVRDTVEAVFASESVKTQVKPC